jgi:hypothetical protein
MDRIAAFREGPVHGWDRVTHVDELRVGFLANFAESGFESVGRETVITFALSTLDLVGRR